MLPNPEREWRRIDREELAELDGGDALALGLAAHSTDTVPDCAVYSKTHHNVLVPGKFDGFNGDHQRRSVREYDRPMLDIKIRGEDGFYARYSMDNGYVHHSEYDRDAGKISGLYVPA